MPAATARDATTTPDCVDAAIRLRAAVSHLTRQLRARSSASTPGAAKLGVLGQLYRLGPLTPTRLARYEQVRLQTLTRLLAELESAKLIRRRPHPDDARQTLLTISASGTRMLTADIGRREASLAAALAESLDPGERARLVAACGLIERLGDALATASEAR